MRPTRMLHPNYRCLQQTGIAHRNEAVQNIMYNHVGSYAGPVLIFELNLFLISASFYNQFVQNVF